MDEKPWVDQTYLLQKFPGKGGWTYTIIPEIPPDKHAPFGWICVKGSIDGYKIGNHHLMPAETGSGQLLLSVKSEIRKKIRKEAGDFVHIILYPDREPAAVSDELLLCLQDDPEALQFFDSLPEAEQRKYVRWIQAARKDRTRADRIARTLTGLSRHLKFKDL